MPDQEGDGEIRAPRLARKIQKGGSRTGIGRVGAVDDVKPFFSQGFGDVIRTPGADDRLLELQVIFANKHERNSARGLGAARSRNGKGRRQRSGDEYPMSRPLAVLRCPRPE